MLVGPAVGGPVHVVGLGELERCVAQRARAICGSQRTPLRPVRQPLLATQQQAYAIRADDDGCDGAQAGPAAHGFDRDAVHAGADIEHRVLMPTSRHDRPFVDQHAHIRPTRPARRPGAPLHQRQQCVGLQELLPLNRIRRAPIGLPCVEQLFDLVAQPAGELDTRHRIEPAIESDHPVGIDPPPQPDRGLLSLQFRQPIIRPRLAHHRLDEPAERALAHRHRGTSQFVTPCCDPGFLRRRQTSRRSRDHINPLARRGTRQQRVAQLRHIACSPRSLTHP